MLRATFDNGKGKQREISLPWYAAFAGVPPRKPKGDPKQKPCASCKGQGKCNTCSGKGKIGGGNNQQKGGGGNNQNNKQDANNNNTANDDRDRESYTLEDDQKIIELKASNTPWADILTAINKTSKSQLIEHYKKDLANGANNNNNTNIGDKQGGGNNAQTGKGGKGGNIAKADLTAKMLRELAKEEDQKWARMASRHFDQTGERISADRAKALYGK